MVCLAFVCNIIIVYILVLKVNSKNTLIQIFMCWPSTTKCFYYSDIAFAFLKCDLYFVGSNFYFALCCYHNVIFASLSFSQCSLNNIPCGIAHICAAPEDTSIKCAQRSTFSNEFTFALQ